MIHGYTQARTGQPGKKKSRCLNDLVLSLFFPSTWEYGSLATFHLLSISANSWKNVSILDSYLITAIFTSMFSSPVYVFTMHSIAIETEWLKTNDLMFIFWKSIWIFFSGTENAFNSILYQCTDLIWILVRNQLLCFADFKVLSFTFGSRTFSNFIFGELILASGNFAQIQSHLFDAPDVFRNSYFDGVTKVNRENTLKQMNGKWIIFSTWNLLTINRKYCLFFLIHEIYDTKHSSGFFYF